ncbi:LPS translocon maturation chaperone LptM [Undibacterium sp. MH2W]|uniref:LPS translocon maturation chaperone LptM n=1 Tax=Undibacterium sp. MH2W TaxID=3413044 RepID=UPI003BF1511B
MRTPISSLVFSLFFVATLSACGARGPLYMPAKSMTNELPVAKPITPTGTPTPTNTPPKGEAQ